MLGRHGRSRGPDPNPSSAEGDQKLASEEASSGTRFLLLCPWYTRYCGIRPYKAIIPSIAERRPCRRPTPQTDDVRPASASAHAVALRPA